MCGTLGEQVGWHYGFTAAGIGMTIALIVYICAIPALPPDELQRARADGAGAGQNKAASPAVLAERTKTQNEYNRVKP